MNVIKKVFFIALMICTLSVVSNGATGKINTDGARMRREPNTTSDVLTIVYSGETVEIIEKQGEWYKVKYGEHQGYIREDLMQVDEQEPEVKQPEKTLNEKVKTLVETKIEKYACSAMSIYLLLKNKYGYFKNALIDNIHRFQNQPEYLYEDDEYDWLNDDSDELEL